MSVFAIGLDNDKTLMRFVNQAREAGEDVTLINLHDVHREPWHIAIPACSGASVVLGNRERLHLDPHASYYSRLVDLSAVLSEPDSSAWRHLVAAFSAFLETVPGRVVNRPGSHVHNAAKPYHEWWLARQGFMVPPAVTTSDREVAIRFLNTHGTGIVKSLCGMRGTAQAVTRQDFEEFKPEQGPIHLQKYVAGYDIRAHVIGHDLHAEKIETTSVDYRSREAETVHMAATLPDKLVKAMICAAEKMGLAFTGWDFKVDADGQYWCLEVNPMPGYDVYDRRAGGAISRSIMNYLARGVTSPAVPDQRESNAKGN